MSLLTPGGHLGHCTHSMQIGQEVNRVRLLLTAEDPSCLWEPVKALPRCWLHIQHPYCEDLGAYQNKVGVPVRGAVSS